TNQTEGTPNAEGQVWVYSGETGGLLGTFTAPDPGNPGNAAGNNRALVDRWMDRLGDIGSCPANTPAGQTCTSGTIGPPDGAADFFVGAEGVDVAPARDTGRVYVIDGRTLSVLKRIDMPPADRAILAARQAQQSQFPGPAIVVRGGFGRTAITPRGLPVCTGNGGVTPCPSVTLMPQAVRIGDMDGGGVPDAVIGANRFTEIGSTAAPGSHCQQTDPAGTNLSAVCFDAGRAYMYRGEDIAGSNPATPLETPMRTLRNPAAQSDVNDQTFTRSEIFGHAMFPIGDVGQCRTGGAFGTVGPGERCTTAARTNVPDGRPDVIISAHRADATPFNPDPSRWEEGFSFLIDGATGAYLHIYHHPEPQANALFGYTTRQSFPIGDVGFSPLPDLVQGAFQTTHDRAQAGRLYLLNGDFNASFPLIQALNDPTPTTNERFGIAREAVGDLVPGNTGPELLVGVFPSNEQGFPDARTDLHFMNSRSGEELQRISDPDNQLASQFGYQVSPLGDLNVDGFLDFATAAPSWESPGAGAAAGRTNQGRIYIYRSDNSPPPASRRPAAPTPAAPARSLAGCAAGKASLSLTAGNDTRNGTPRGDLIFAGAGNDIIDALAGDDCVDLGLGNDRGQGGAGKDLVLGEGGDDRILGNDDDDRLRGGPGIDTVLGGFGNDTLHGQSGNDRVEGSRGRDRINGGSARDRLSGGSGVDRVSGDAGNDRIAGGSSNDVLRGNSGNDVINGGSGRDRISCGRGRDTVIADRRDRVGRDCERVRRRR
ncbi:MAG: hypothetical protein M3217_11975, partial [Actinomycetota bacterium]|nr:hypothetical protein [Actinomycetota bacterium]